MFALMTYIVWDETRSSLNNLTKNIVLLSVWRQNLAFFTWKIIFHDHTEDDRFHMMILFHLWLWVSIPGSPKLQKQTRAENRAELQLVPVHSEDVNLCWTQEGWAVTEEATLQLVTACEGLVCDDAEGQRSQHVCPTCMEPSVRENGGWRNRWSHQGSWVTKRPNGGSVTGHQIDRMELIDLLVLRPPRLRHQHKNKHNAAFFK